jgi:sigma-B regulation protein RsbU (phosphoserine phosphatase)
VDESVLEPARLFDEAACGLVVTDEAGTILRANATFCVWLGYSPDELTGSRRFQDMFTMGARIFHQTHWAPLLRMQGSIAEVKLDIQHRDGTRLPLLMNAVRHTKGDEVWHEIAVFIAKDRSQYEKELLLARKRAEESLRTQLEAQRSLALAETRLRLALDSSELFVWDVDPATRERRYDDGVALLLGYKDPRPISAAEVLQAMPAEDRQAETDALNRALAAPSDPLRYTIRLDGADGNRRVAGASGIGLFGADGELVRFVGVLQDITEQSRRRASAEDRARFAEQMVGIVSHDLRNPLSSIKMAAELLLRGAPTPQQARLLGHINQATDRSKRLIAELLDFTQARVGRGISIAQQGLDLHGVIARGLAELRLAFPGRALEHTSEGAGACRADPDRLIQLLGNLVANAVAYGAPNTPIGVRTLIEPSSFSVAVHNQGAPIPGVLLGTMFEPMTRGDVVDDGTRSVGLGLYIVQQIAQAHGGRVSVASDANTGTVFTAVFPRLPDLR